MRQWLIHAAHNAEADMLIPALHEYRNDGVKRPLTTGESKRAKKVLGFTEYSCDV
jgi:hypothetical protein